MTDDIDSMHTITGICRDHKSRMADVVVLSESVTARGAIRLCLVAFVHIFNSFNELARVWAGGFRPLLTWNQILIWVSVAFVSDT